MEDLAGQWGGWGQPEEGQSQQAYREAATYRLAHRILTLMTDTAVWYKLTEHEYLRGPTADSEMRI